MLYVSMCVYINVICLHIFVYICVYVYIYIYIYVYMFICIYIYTYIHTYVSIYVRTTGRGRLSRKRRRSGRALASSRAAVRF